VQRREAQPRGCTREEEGRRGTAPLVEPNGTSSSCSESHAVQHEVSVADARHACMLALISAPVRHVRELHAQMICLRHTRCNKGRRLAPGGRGACFSLQCMYVLRVVCGSALRVTRACSVLQRRPAQNFARLVSATDTWCCKGNFPAHGVSVPFGSTGGAVPLRPSHILVDVLRAAARFVPSHVMAQCMCAVHC